jgi:hypothetical protein
MRALLLLLLLATVSPSWGSEASISPSDVFIQAQIIEREAELIKQHLGVTQQPPALQIKIPLQPRHVWQTSYFILTKINVFRRQQGLPVNTANSVEPVLELDPAMVYEQTQRILTEIRILKTRLGIKGQVAQPEPVSGKRPIDVFNKLNVISAQWDALNGEEISPSYVFAEVLRIFADINTILQTQRIEDPTYPPGKQQHAQTQDSLNAAYELVQEVQRLQRDAGIKQTDLSVFRRPDEAQSADVFNMVGMGLAELQTIKAYLGLSQALTPPAGFYRDKTPADVHQLLRWVTYKLRLVRSL